MALNYFLRPSLDTRNHPLEVQVPLKKEELPFKFQQHQLDDYRPKIKRAVVAQVVPTAPPKYQPPINTPWLACCCTEQIELRSYPIHCKNFAQLHFSDCKCAKCKNSIQIGESPSPKAKTRLLVANTPCLYIASSPKQIMILQARHQQIKREASHQQGEIMGRDSHSKQINQCSKTPKEIIAFVKEQIEIAVNIYSNKYNSLLKDQANEITQLRQILQSNSDLLNKKSNASISYLSNHGLAKPKRKEHVIFNSKVPLIRFGQIKGRQSMAVPEYILTRISGIETQIGLILEWEQHQRESLKSISWKMGQLEKLIVGIFGKRLLNCKQKVGGLGCSLQRSLEATISDRLQGALQAVRLEMSRIRWGENAAKIRDLHEQIVQMKKQTHERGNYEYDNYNYIELRQSFLQLKEQVGRLEERNTHREKKRRQVQVSQPELPGWQDLTNQREIISANKSGSPIEQLSGSPLEQFEDNIERFMTMIIDKQLAQPVAVKIDSTGYAKFTKTNLYALDQKGIGFRFSKQDINALINMRVISV